MSTCHSPLRPKPTQELSTEDEENSIREPWTVIKLCSITKSCLTLWDPIDYSPPGSSVHDILQARTLEWIVMSSSRGIFPTQGLNVGLPHCRQILYHLSHREDFVGGKEGKGGNRGLPASLLGLQGLGALSSLAPTLSPKSVETGNQVGPCTEDPRPHGRCGPIAPGLGLWSRLLPRAE